MRIIEMSLILIFKLFYYQAICLINAHIFEYLEKNTVDIFIGVITGLIAIVIFVSERLGDAKNDTEKKFMLHITKIKKIMIFSLITLSFCIFAQLFKRNDNEFLYFLFSFIKYSLIGCSIYYTIKLFSISLKLNTDTKYFYSELKKYIYYKLNDDFQKNIQKNEKYHSDENLDTDNYIADNSKYYSRELIESSDYVHIRANKSGRFKCYSISVLQKIVEDIENTYFKSIEYVPNSLPLIVLPLKNGEEINRGVVIAYCKNDVMSSITNINDIIINSIVYYNKQFLQNIDAVSIIEEFHSDFLSERPIPFYSDDNLYDLYSFLYEKNMYPLIDKAFDYLEEILSSCIGEYSKNKKIAKFLSLLVHLTYVKEDYYHYRRLNQLIYLCYAYQLKQTDDKRQVCYDYATNLISYNYYSVRKNDDSIYYDVLLSNLLIFLLDLIVIKEFKAINDFFYNVGFDYNNSLFDDPDDFEILNMQFSFGFAYGLIMASKANKISKEDQKNIIATINNVKTFFVNIYSQNDAIYYFKKYFNKSSNIQSTYSNFDFRFVEKDYRNSWSGFSIDNMTVLKEFINLFRIDFSNLKDIDESLITREGKYDYERLLESIKAEEKSELDEILDLNYDKDSLRDLLEILIKKSTAEQKKYNRSNPLDDSKLTKFKMLIFKKIKEGNELINYLTEIKKYKYTRTKGKNCIGFNQLIGRDLFFNDIYGYDNIAQDYGRAIIDGISREYLKKLDEISKIKKVNFSDYLSSLSMEDEYIIISNRSNRRKLNVVDYNATSIEFNGRSIKLIINRSAKDIYLIKVKDLPIVELLRPSNSDGVFEKGIYYKMIDCSKDKVERTQIQKESAWLKEKGSVEEQLEYLKEKCKLELYVFPSISVKKEAKCVKLILDEEDLTNV